MWPSVFVGGSIPDLFFLHDDASAGKTGLEKEQEFIRKCMESLLMASANLEKDAHSSLTSIERGLLMLKTHLEAFRRRYVLRGPTRTVVPAVPQT